MPNNILITPSSASIQFSGSAANTIRLVVEPSGSIAFYGSSGSLFGISDSLSGSLMSVNDISGLPILEVFSDDRVVMGSLNKNTLVVTGSRVGIFKTAPTATLDVSGSVFITGSLNVTAGITGSLLGTSSWASNAISSSFSTTSSFASTAQTLLGSVVSASYAATASLLLGSIESASFATTASYAANAGTPDWSTIANKPAGLVSSSAQINTGSFTGSFTGTFVGTSSWASNVISASFATTSSFASTAQTLLGSVTSASYAATASLLLGSAVSASFATTASYAPSILAIKSGVTGSGAFAGNPKKATITFTTPFSASSNYAPVVVGEDARSWTVETKVSGSFVINSNANTAIAGSTYWHAIAYGET